MYVILGDALAEYEETTPYTIALVKLQEGLVITAQLTGLDNQSVQIGVPVEIVTRRIGQDGDEHGMLFYGYKFRPALR